MRLAAGGREVAREGRTFAATTAGLPGLAERLAENGRTRAATGAAGVYWRPVWHILAEGGFVPVPANAAQVRNVPGRETDVGDATWPAELPAHGPVRPGFVPDAPTRELRALPRTGRQPAREGAGHAQRPRKTLEDADVELGAVPADPPGASGRAMLEASAAGEGDPAALAAPARPRPAATPGRLREAPRGRAARRHRFPLRPRLDQADAPEAAIARVDREAEAHLAPFRAVVELPAPVPGVGAPAARVIVAGVGTDMGRFPSARHLVPWAGPRPRSDGSAGERRPTRLREGAPRLKATLVQCARAAGRREAGHLQARLHRPRARRGAKGAARAVAASVPTAAYRMLKDGTACRDLGPDHFDRRSREVRARRLVRRLAGLGYAVELAPSGPAPA